MERPARLCHLSSSVTETVDEKAAEGFQKHHHKDNNNPIILTADLDLTKLLWLSFKVIVMSPGWSRSKGKGIKWDGETLFGLV